MSIQSEQLDRRFKVIKQALPAMARPHTGWVRAIRESLGMTGRQLGQRMGLSPSRVTEIEISERTGQITIRSMERVAEALGCRFVYVLVPAKPLQKMIDEQATKIAEQRIAHVEQTMKLEDQTVFDRKQQERMKRELIESLLKTKGRIWDEA